MVNSHGLCFLLPYAHAETLTMEVTEKDMRLHSVSTTKSKKL